MRQTILGRKLGMTQIFDHQGNAIPITIIQAGPCRVLQVKTLETDGYNAIQLGFVDKKEKKTTKPLIGHFSKAGSQPQRHVRETRVEDPSIFSLGQVVTSGRFVKGDFIDISGTSKGKGFAGVMKRHGFRGFTATHGTHESKRGPGSIGQAADPAKTFKGIKMAGRMGGETVTVQNLVIVDTREDQNLLFIKGPVPGGKNSLLVIRHSVKKAAPPLREKEPAPEEQVEPVGEDADAVPVTAEEEIPETETSTEQAGSEEEAPAETPTAEPSAEESPLSDPEAEADDDEPKTDEAPAEEPATEADKATKEIEEEKVD